MQFSETIRSTRFKWKCKVLDRPVHRPVNNKLTKAGIIDGAGLHRVRGIIELLSGRHG